MNEDGAIVATVRQMRKITQQGLAAALSLGIDTVGRLERGDPRVEKMTRARIAEYLGLTYDWNKRRVLPPKDLPPAAWRRRLESETRDNTSSRGTSAADEPLTAVFQQLRKAIGNDADVGALLTSIAKAPTVVRPLIAAIETGDLDNVRGLLSEEAVRGMRATASSSRRAAKTIPTSPSKRLRDDPEK